MPARRIAIGACALCLAIPAAAGASQSTDPPKPIGPYGATSAAGLRNTVKPKGPYATITAAGVRNVGKPIGPYGATTATGLRNTVKPMGPYAVTTATRFQQSTASRTHAASAPGRDRTNGWRTAAISGAALLAALALGSVALLPARRRAARMVT